MSVSWDMVKDFWDYLECYPGEDEPGYDGVHDGDVKGLAADAPESAKKAYEKYEKMIEEAEKKGIKV